MTASYKIALAAGGLLLLIVISSLILRSETPGDTNPDDNTLALNDTDRPAPGPGADSTSGSSATLEVGDALGDPLEPLPEAEITPAGPPRRDSVGPPFGVSDDPATRINFIEDDSLAGLPEAQDNGFPTLDVGRRPFENRDSLFTNDSDVIVADLSGSETVASPEPEPIAVPRPAVAIGPTDPVARPTAQANQPTADAERPAPRREPAILRLYTVEAGDSMSSIALATYGSALNWVDIAQANPLVDPNRLRVGQEIKLPDLDGIGAAAGGKPRAARAAEDEQDLPRSGATYTIKSGDSLSTVAKQFYGSASKWELIYQANRRAIGDDPGRLQLGMELLIPPPANGAN
ncbi:MAG: LysM peptidoglycan-binding domain-containing protein [Planctomycetota bacterium]